MRSSTTTGSGFRALMGMKTPIILVYHQISDLPVELDPYHVSVSIDVFEWQMSYLKAAGYRVLKLTDAVRKMRAGEPLPPKSLVITFDDGYQDNYVHAFPVLRKYGFPATIYLVADYLGQSAVWHGELGHQFPLMGLDEIAEMQESDIEFGSHTRTHAALNKLDAEQVTWEIQTSKQVLEDQLGRPVETIAYPYEGFDEQCQIIAEQGGFLAACGSHRMPETYYNLWRAEIGRAEHDARRFKFKLSHMHKMMCQAKRMLRPVKQLLR